MKIPTRVRIGLFVERYWRGIVAASLCGIAMGLANHEGYGHGYNCGVNNSLAAVEKWGKAEPDLKISELFGKLRTPDKEA